MKKIAVVLSGCGYLDGAEITESVSTLIALGEAGAEYQCFAPTTELNVTDHVKGEGTGEKRNILTEAARIARGQVKDISTLDPSDFDGIAFPGGFGAALNLSNWANEGAGTKLNADVERVIKGFHSEGKPICAICIAPTLVAKTLGENDVNLTIGNDKETAEEIEKTGAKHIDCKVTDYVTDRENKVITTPAYMYDAKPIEVFTGIRGAIKEFVEMA